MILSRPRPIAKHRVACWRLQSRFCLAWPSQRRRGRRTWLRTRISSKVLTPIPMGAATSQRCWSAIVGSPFCRGIDVQPSHRHLFGDLISGVFRGQLYWSGNLHSQFRKYGFSRGSDAAGDLQLRRTGVGYKLDPHLLHDRGQQYRVSVQSRCRGSAGPTTRARRRDIVVWHAAGGAGRPAPPQPAKAENRLLNRCSEAMVGQSRDHVGIPIMLSRGKAFVSIARSAAPAGSAR